MTKQRLSFKQKMLKIGSWLLLTIGPAIIAVALVIFSYGRDAQGYIDKIDRIEQIEPRIQKLEPLTAQNVFDVLLLKIDIQNLKIKEEKLLQFSIDIDKKFETLIGVLNEQRDRSIQDRNDLRSWMNRVEDRLNGFR